MRLNPFSRSQGRGGYSDDDEEEDVAVARMKRNSNIKRAPPTPRRKTISPESEEDEYRRRPSHNSSYTPRGRAPAGGSSDGRPRSRSGSRGRAMTPDSRKRLSSQRDSPYSSSPELDIVRQNSSNVRPRRGRDATPDARRPPQQRRGSSRGASSHRSSSPERRPPRRSSAASRASSRRSRPSRAYSISSDEDEEREMTTSQRRRMSGSRHYRGESPEPRGRRRFQSDDEDDELRSRGRVVPLSSARRSRSRGASSSEDDEDEMMMNRPPRRKSGSHHHRPRSGSRSRHAAASSQQRRHSSSKATTVKTKKNGWGFKSPFGRRGKPKAEMRDDDVDIESNSEDEYEQQPMRRGVDNMAPMPRELPLHPPQPPSPQIAKLDEHYVVPKREKFANLYEFDNFPGIDRVPTAIGYCSDESNEDLLEDGGGDDNASFTSRYTVDVKSVRGSKLKKNKLSANSNVIHSRLMDPDGDDNFSHDENDDKYAQYLAGATSNAVLSDSSDSCPPTWHPALDVDESDWYDDDEAAMTKMKKQHAKMKKYQVSGSKPKSGKKKKVPVTTESSPKAAKEDKAQKTTKEEEEHDKEPEEQEDRGDAIVANRSEASDIVPNSSRHPGPRRNPALDDAEEASEEDERAEGRSRRRKRRGRKHRRKGFDLDEDEEDYMEEDETSYSEDDFTDRIRRQSQKMRKQGGAMNASSPQGKKRNMKPLAKGKSKAKSLTSKFKSFRRGSRSPTAEYASSSDESSEISESVRLAPSQSMLSEDPPRKPKVDPALAKLEMDEFKESTATHNMIRNNQKELLELDEMDEASLKADPNAFSCGVFPFGIGIGGGTASNCFYGSSGRGRADDVQLDSIQMQRLKDAKHDLENKPKVEVILQDLQDPLAEKYDQLEKQQRKQQREAQREKQAQQEIERREREELLRKKREIRETEQKKIQNIQNRDQLALQEAPDLSRGKSQSFVMDISDWVLNLDTSEPTTPIPKKKPLAPRENQTPRTNGRDGSSPIEKLPFNTIEVPTTIDNSDGHLQPPAKTQQGWRRKKKRGVSNPRPGQDSVPPEPLRQQNGKAVPQARDNSAARKKTPVKKKGWFRR